MRDDTKGKTREETKPSDVRDETPSNIKDETTSLGLWYRSKAWAAKNRTISGALIGGAAGCIVPGIGALFGAIVGAGVGFASSKERSDDLGPGLDAPETARSRRGE